MAKNQSKTDSYKILTHTLNLDFQEFTLYKICLSLLEI